MFCFLSALPVLSLSQLSQELNQAQKVRVDRRELERFEPLTVWQFVSVAVHTITNCLGSTLVYPFYSLEMKITRFSWVWCQPGVEWCLNSDCLMTPKNSRMLKIQRNRIVGQNPHCGASQAALPLQDQCGRCDLRGRRGTERAVISYKLRKL